MIGYLRGKIEDKSEALVTVDVAGVGYEVTCSAALLSHVEVGSEEFEFIIHTEVRDDFIGLYGFSTRNERAVFRLLTSVKGVGCRMAMDLISQVELDDLLFAIAGEDSKRIQEVKGVGKKTAERIVVDLKDKVQKHIGLDDSTELRSQIERISEIASHGAAHDALEALCALGFSHEQSRRALGQLPKEAFATSDAGELVTRALEIL